MFFARYRRRESKEEAKNLFGALFSFARDIALDKGRAVEV